MKDRRSVATQLKKKNTSFNGFIQNALGLNYL